jgi:hypothetical protein
MNIQEELEKAWEKHRPWGQAENSPPDMKFVDGFLAGMAVGALVEREACAGICDDLHDAWRWDDELTSDSGPRSCAAAIRTRITIKDTVE